MAGGEEKVRNGKQVVGEAGKSGGVQVSIVHVWDGWRRGQTGSYLFQTIRAASVRRDGFQRIHTIKWEQRKTWICLWNIFRHRLRWKD